MHSAFWMVVVGAIAAATIGLINLLTRRRSRAVGTTDCPYYPETPRAISDIRGHYWGDSGAGGGGGGGGGGDGGGGGGGGDGGGGGG